MRCLYLHNTYTERSVRYITKYRKQFVDSMYNKFHICEKVKTKILYKFVGTYMHVPMYIKYKMYAHIIDSSNLSLGEWEIGDGKKRFQHYLQYLNYY